MVSGDIGLPSKPLKFHGEQLVFEERTSDPASTSKGEMWLRTDLTSDGPNQFATLRFDNGSGFWDIPVFQTGTSGTNVEEVLRIPVGGTVGFVPILDTSPAFPELGFQHAGTRYGLHDWPGGAPTSGVARWTFDDDDTSGSTALDVWNNNDATINGATTGAGGQYGEAYSFDGVDDWVDLPLGVLNADAGSLSCWVNAEFSGMSNADVRIWSTQTSSTVDTVIRTYNNTHVNLLVGDQSGGFVAVSAFPSSPADNTWHHIVYTWNYDGADTQLKAFNNGSLNDSQTLTGHKIPLPDTEFAIARWPNNSAYFPGLVDDPRVYNKALSSTEVSDLYNSGSI